MSILENFLRTAGVAEGAVQRAAVIGAGAMGAGIAAQFANAGVPVDLLDIAGPEEARNGPAQAGVERQLKAQGFMHPDAARLVRVGNIDDHLDRLADVDWVVEAVIEKLAVKRDLYRRIEQVVGPQTIISSNTSTIPRAELVAGRSASFTAQFIIAHFFNPPRVMRLVELVSAPETDASILANVREASENILGKTLVDCRDTPGFIANRIGCYWIAVAVLEAQRLGVTPEAADLVMSALGIPKTGVFGLLDLVGIDLVPQVWGSLMSSLPAADALHGYDLPNAPTIGDMIAAGRFGRKAKAGFYRLNADQQRETLDFASSAYRPALDLKPAILPGGGKDIVTLLDADDRLGQYAWSVISRVVHYAAQIGPEVAADTGAIDAAVELGYAWKQGPLHIADRYGVGRLVERFAATGLTIPPLLQTAVEAGGFFGPVGRPLSTSGRQLLDIAPGVTGTLRAGVAGQQPICSNAAASLWDLGNGVAGFEMHTKLNSFAPAVFDVLEETLARSGKDFGGLVLANDDVRAFSAGADLGYLIGLVRDRDYASLAAYIRRGQQAFQALKYASIPVVAAAHGLALGGGCEFTLHADRVVAHAEYMGALPEVKVGLVPGWGGCTQLLLRAQADGNRPGGFAAAAARTFSSIFAGEQSGSALEARAMGLLRAGDIQVMSRERLLHYAVKEVQALMQAAYQPPVAASIIVTGPSGKLGLMNEVRAARASGRLTDTDVGIAEVLASVLTGGPNGDTSQAISEQDMMALELAGLMELVQTPASQARIEQMLATGKPLRN